MQTEYGLIPESFVTIAYLNHNVISNEYNGYLSYYLSEQDFINGRTPIHGHAISWIGEGTNSSVIATALSMSQN